MWWPHAVHVHDWRRCVVAYLLKVRFCSHFGHMARSPSEENRVRHSHSRQASSSGYSRQNSIKETRESEDLARTGLFDAKTGLPAVIPAGRNPKYMAVEQVGGVDSHKVTATYSASQIHSMLPQLNSSGEVDATIWIGGSDHLIRKAVLSGAFGDNGTASSVEVDLSGFNGSVVIATPSLP